tara:strand:- start:1276 stop:1623 length:348 start_codon:yes stop_codon:yes gene_type:complete
VLTSAYPNRKINEDNLRVYADSLIDISPERLKVAFKDIIKTSKHFPAVAEIRTVCNRIRDEMNVERSKHEKLLDKPFVPLPDFEVRENLKKINELIKESSERATFPKNKKLDKAV